MSLSEWKSLFSRPTQCGKASVPASHASSDRRYSRIGITHGPCRRQPFPPLAGYIQQHREHLSFSKIKREAAAQRRPARSERKNRFFSRNDRFPQCSTDAAHTPGRRLSVSAIQIRPSPPPKQRPASRKPFFLPHMGKYHYLPRDLHKYLDVIKNITLEYLSLEHF